MDDTRKTYFASSIAAACIISMATYATDEPITAQSISVTAETVAAISKGAIEQGFSYFLIDSGAECHITTSRSDFIDGTFVPFDKDVNVLGAGGEAHCVAGSGDIRIRISAPAKKEYDLVISDVYLVESFKLRIVSTGKLRKEGIGVYLPPSAPGFLDVNGGERAPLHPRGNLDFIKGRLNAPGRVHNIKETRNSFNSFKTWCNASTKEDLIERLAYPHNGDTSSRAVHARRTSTCCGVHSTP
jgi:hypothetical protein